MQQWQLGAVAVRGSSKVSSPPHVFWCHCLLHSSWSNKIWTFVLGFQCSALPPVYGCGLLSVYLSTGESSALCFYKMELSHHDNMDQGSSSSIGPQSISPRGSITATSPGLLGPIVAQLSTEGSVRFQPEGSSGALSAAFPGGSIPPMQRGSWPDVLFDPFHSGPSRSQPDGSQYSGPEDRSLSRPSQPLSLEVNRAQPDGAGGVQMFTLPNLLSPGECRPLSPGSGSSASHAGISPSVKLSQSPSRSPLPELCTFDPATSGKLLLMERKEALPKAESSDYLSAGRTGSSHRPVSLPKAISSELISGGRIGPSKPGMLLKAESEEFTSYGRAGSSPGLPSCVDTSEALQGRAAEDATFRDLRKKLSSASRTTKLNKDWGNKFWGINSPEDALTQGGCLDLRSLDLPLEVLYTEIVPKVQPASTSCASLITVVTWNVGTAMPPSDVTSLLHLNMGDTTDTDMIAIGLQEVNSMINKRLKDALFMDQWSELFMDVLSPFNFVLVSTVRMQGVILLVFSKYYHLPFLQDIQTDCTRTGLGGYWGNKGGVSVRLSIFGHMVCFLNCHLPAHLEKAEQRKEDFTTILNMQQFEGRVASGILDHDIVFWFGDLNFRIESLDIRFVKYAIDNNILSQLWEKDQLNIAKNTWPILSGFQEGPLNFPPTFKFDVGTNKYDTSAKKRKPAWTDRILWKIKSSGASHNPSGRRPSRSILSVTQLCYCSHMEYMVSDHKPVAAIFAVQFPSKTDKPLVEIQVADEWSRPDQAVVRYKVASIFHRSSWDWIGLYRISLPTSEAGSSPMDSSSTSSDEEDDSTLVLLAPKSRSPSPGKMKRHRSRSPGLSKFQGLILRPSSRERAASRSPSPQSHCGLKGDIPSIHLPQDQLPRFNSKGKEPARTLESRESCIAPSYRTVGEHGGIRDSPLAKTDPRNLSLLPTLRLETFDQAMDQRRGSADQGYPARRMSPTSPTAMLAGLFSTSPKEGSSPKEAKDLESYVRNMSH
ncbi:phosphatidylinositol 4,5-bisphosphate 5-phosphatase A isoform X3 [Alligator sinensis]|uniref:Phosphatidylinositol 4,5-bisphosphate 5-phosphatase A isoform X3 n=1 Tax=Alligator sinensis TaxID=38654 RepID=A0A3Q0HL50_ALLSI|nr:phosphatidylinositol 4,5-bisphosphate 5-phosphatase A isoform X3 [Alligator sinensis]